MMFRKEHGKINVTSLVERVSRYAVVMRNEDRQSKPIMEALINGLAPLPADARQSITFDRGTEFSAWRRLKDGIGADSWFCDPQAPWQKGTVENTNYRLRKYLRAHVIDRLQAGWTPEQIAGRLGYDDQPVRGLRPDTGGRDVGGTSRTEGLRDT